MNRFYLALILSIFLVVRFYFYLTASKPFNEGDSVRITARVTSEPVRYEKVQYLNLHGLKVYLRLYPEVGYGDRVVVEGKVEKGELKGSKLVTFIENKSFGYKIREKIIESYKKALPKPHSSLISGMVLGSKADLSQDFWEKLKSTGTAHVVVASGMNVLLIANFLIATLTLFWKRKNALVFTLVGVWGYAFLTGLDAPIIRAAVMGTLVFLAQYLGKTSESIRALILSAFMMLMVNPTYLWDLGFLLSFFATLSLVLFEPKVKKLILRACPTLEGSDPVRSTIVSDFSTSLSAQIGVAPILYFYFGQVNVFSPLINTLILWTVVPITVLGMIGGVVGLLFEPLGRVILYLVYPLSSWFNFVVTIFS